MTNLIHKSKIFMNYQAQILVNKIKNNDGVADEHTNRFGYIIIGIVIIGVLLILAKNTMPTIWNAVVDKLLGLFK